MTATQASYGGLADEDRRRIGGAIQVTLPLENKSLLREVAAALEALAQVMECQGRRRGVTELEALVRVKFEARLTNNLIAAACARHGVDLAETASDAA